MLNLTELIVEEDSESSLVLIDDSPQTAVNGVISLSYVNRNFPFLYRNPHTGVVSGIYADMWSALARMEKKTLIFERGTVYGGYTPDPDTGKFDGILGWLQEGVVDGIAEEFTYRSSRMDYFYSTTPIDYSVETFYERTSVLTDDINNFIVFPPSILALIVGSFLVINIVERTALVFRYRLRRRTVPAITIGKERKFRLVNSLEPFLLRHPRLNSIFHFLLDFFSPDISWDYYATGNRRPYMLLYVVSSLFIFLFYSAVFAGNAVVTVTKADIHLKQLIHLFQSDEKTLIMRDLAYIKRNTLAEMFGRDVFDDRKRVQIQPNMQLFVNELCSDPSLVGFVSNFQTVTYNPHDPFIIPCKLAEIETAGNFAANSLVGQAMYGKERPVTFYVGKHMKRKTMDTFNQILLTMYDNEKMTDLWWRRYTSRPRRDTSPLSIMSFDPVPIHTLKTFLIICGGFYVVSILAFVIEAAIGIFKKWRK